MEALKSYEAAMAIYIEMSNPLGQANVLNNIGMVYGDQGKLEEALKSYETAMAIYIEIGYPLGRAKALNNIGVVYYNQGKVE